MQTTLQALIKMANDSFRGVKVGRLSVFYSEGENNFFLYDGSDTDSPAHNNLGRIISESRSKYPRMSCKRLKVIWSDTMIRVEYN